MTYYFIPSFFASTSNIIKRHIFTTKMSASSSNIYITWEKTKWFIIIKNENLKLCLDKNTIFTSSRIDCGELPANNFEHMKSTNVGSGSPIYSIIFLLIHDWTFFLIVPSISVRSSGWLKRSSLSIGILSIICLCNFRFSSCERTMSASDFFCPSPSRLEDFFAFAAASS